MKVGRSKMEVRSCWKDGMMEKWEDEEWKVATNNQISNYPQ